MKELWVPLSAAIAQQYKVDTIANNVANANTAGFKKDEMVFKEYLTAVDKGIEDIDLPRKEWSPKDFYHSHGAEHAFVKIDGTYTSHEQGRLDPTNNPLDLGLNGTGFFEVLTPYGIKYTRKGNFTLDKEGHIVTAEGHFLLSKLDKEELKTNPETVPQPEARKIKLPQGQFSINNEGQLYSNTGLIGEISIVEMNDVNALRKEGSSLFANADNANLRDGPVKTKVNQGFLEGSNVNAMAEMTELIKANRQFQNVLKAIKTYDAIEGRAVNDLAKF